MIRALLEPSDFAEGIVKEIASAKLGTTNGDVMLLAEDGTELRMPVGVLVTLANQARRLVAGADASPPDGPPGPAPTRVHSFTLDANETSGDLVLRLDPGTPFEFPVLMDNGVATRLAFDLLRALNRRTADTETGVG
ncbi:MULTISPECIES: hypothetical protein [unclassified Chelatococcus]|uniref:hypothetical protein n=1 Tax=unclassified Chelatococcus TaxID=2638111 RepID=UPI000306FDB7|nr:MULTISPECIES: hypothetical protein [unclassified Chelatococcus]